MINMKKSYMVKGMKIVNNDFITDTELIGETVFVKDLDGEVIGTYSALNLTRDFITMSNDAFYETYGFNWCPTFELQEKARITFDL